MDERTDQPPPRPEPFCHQHGEHAATVLPVRTVARNSGPDVLLYACAPCRKEHGLEPLQAAS